MIHEVRRRRVIMTVAMALFGARGSLAASPAATTSGTAPDLRAPFGLTWGLSVDDIKKLDVALLPLPGRSDYGVGFSATGLSSTFRISGGQT